MVVNVLRRVAWSVLALSGILALRAEVATAHADTPVRRELLRTGQYNVSVLYYSAPPAGSVLRLPVLPRGPAASGASPVIVRVRASPNFGSRAAPLVGRADADPRWPAFSSIAQPLPDAGTLALSSQFTGPAARAPADPRVTAMKAGAFPVQAAWAIASVPLLGLTWFGYAQWRWFTRHAGSGSDAADRSDDVV